MVSVPFVCSCDGGNSPEDKVETKFEIGSLTVPAEENLQFISVQASGEWEISVKDQSGGQVRWIAISPASGTGSKANVRMSVQANENTTLRSAVLTLKTSTAYIARTLTQKGRQSESGGGESGGGDKPETPEVAKSGWLELPAIPENSKWGFFSHTMTVGSVKTRNYSFAWDYDNLVAPWVAYPLCKWYIGSGSRTNAWGVDPLLPEDKQPILYMHGFSSPTSTRYDRGHQLPSADRLTSNAVNATTFYGTNMTPQINALNAYFWGNLEGKVRSWANSSDTCYVVTGCVTDGSTAYALDNVGKKVTVPTHYYKAVLRYSKNSTYGYSGYMACAIMLEHKDYGNGSDFKPYAISVDELEAKLGIDFFANLPALLGDETAAKVEAEDPKNVKWWWQ